MGDPGLASKFIEMQQEEFVSGNSGLVVPPNPYREGLKMDRARIQAELARATARNHVATLKRALRYIEAKIQRAESSEAS